MWYQHAERCIYGERSSIPFLECRAAYLTQHQKDIMEVFFNHVLYHVLSAIEASGHFCSVFFSEHAHLSPTQVSQYSLTESLA